MQRDIEANEIDWVFCWRTSTGEVLPGARDADMNRGLVRYQPRAPGHNDGLRTVVHGRLHTCPRPPTGPRLDEQGGISRGNLFVWGYVTHAFLVPARNGRELAMLQAAAHKAVLAGDASEWALAEIHARNQVHWAIHLAAHPDIVPRLAARIDAPWTLEVREKTVASWVKGAQILVVGRDGTVIKTLEADMLFDDAPLPLFTSRWTERATDPGADSLSSEEPTIRNTSALRPVTLPDEDVEEDEDDVGAVVDLDEIMVALLESVGVHVGDDDSARMERRSSPDR